MPQAASITLSAERLGDLLLDRALGGRDVELHLPAEEILRIEHAEHEVGVGRRRLGAAAAVAGRARIGAGAARPDAQLAEFDRGDAAAAGADRIDVDRAHLHVGAGDGEFRARDRPPADDHADVEAGAADIGGQDVVGADQFAHRLRAHDAGGGPREQREHRPVVEHGGRQHAAGAGHHQHRHAHAGLAQRVFQPREIAAGHRPERGVGRRGRHPRIFADRRRNLVREADEGVGQFLTHNLAQAQLVHRIDDRRTACRSRPPRRLAASSARIASRACASSSGAITLPLASMRSSTSTIRARGTSGL